MTRSGVRIAVSAMLFVLATAGLIYWGAGMPDGGIRLNMDLEALLHFFGWLTLVFFLAVVVALIGAFLLLPKLKKPGTRSLKQWSIAVLCAVVATLVSLAVPIPQDYPACCMVGPTRERGLPVAYTTSTASFGQNPVFPAPTVRWYGIILNIGYWAFAYFYIERLAKISHSARGIVGGREKGKV